jgi:hypothetical protein
MLRTLITAVTIYGYAQPAFDGYRPAFLEKPLKAFSGEINNGGSRALSAFDKTRLWHYADTVIERVRSQWSATKKG